jgi:hypothetical protein
MALTGVISRFSTGTYTVTRTAAGSYTTGRYAAGAPSTFAITASVQPVQGRDLQSVPEAQRGEEVKVLWTTTELRTRGAGEPDSVSIDGEAWRVVRVKRWQAFGGDGSGDHYEVYVARVVQP